MGKANKKNEKVTSPFQAKDLSLEKRVEMYQVEFENWKKEMAEKYGLTISVELSGYPRALVPQMVLLDLLKNKQDEKKQG